MHVHRGLLATYRSSPAAPGPAAPSASRRRAFASLRLRFDASFPDWQKQIVFDPQTSGGLLVALPAEQAEDLVEALKRVPTPAAVVIGEVTSVAEEGRLVIG